MNQQKPLLLITNDDGVTAEGIRQITEALRDLGERVVFAPDSPRSGMSRAITTTTPLQYHLLHQEEGLTIYSCTGTPVDCVKLAVSEVLTRKPDLLISGINHGGNQALAVHYSGTLGAAFEGSVFEIPSIGISLHDYHPGASFSEACRLGHLLAKKTLEQGLPKGTYLNLNIPNIHPVKGIVAARQTAGKWEREYIRHQTPSGETTYHLTGTFQETGPPYADNDLTALHQGYAPVVPCKIDTTDYPFLEQLKKTLTP
jgi:5'-nucleotidase